MGVDYAMTTWKHIVVGAGMAVISTGCLADAKQTTDGKQLFDNYCATCHVADGSGNADIGAPSLAGLPSWYVEAQLHKFRDGVRGTHFDDIAGMRMRPMSLTLASEPAVQSVAAYVGTLAVSEPEHTVEGDPDKGRISFGACATCHGADAKGLPAGTPPAMPYADKAPPLAQASDWYLERQLHNFKAGIRGKHEDDASGAAMIPWVATLPDDQAIKDVIAYIHTLQ